MTLCKDKRGVDKIYHLLLGAAIALFVGVCYAHISPQTPGIAAVVALSAVLVAAVFWEFYHKRMLRGNHICIWDILWSLAGGVLMCWIPWLIAYLLAVNG